MTDSIKSKVSLALLKAQLKKTLELDLDDFGLEESRTGEYNANFVGVDLQSSFQPIYDVSAGDLLGHEAILRSSLGGIKDSSPEFTFSYAEAQGKLVKLDRVSRTLHVLNYHEIFKDQGLLFLNVHPNLLISVNQHGKVFENILHTHSVTADRVVITIKDLIAPERHENPYVYEKQLIEGLHNYRDRGYKIAVDNFGSKHSLVSRLWKLNPDYVKFDKSLIQEAEHIPRLEKALHGLISLIKSLEAEPIVTGIETATHLDIAMSAGANLVQGDLLGKPAAAKELQSSDVIKRQIPSHQKLVA